MKKYLLILSVCFVAIACSNSTEEKAPPDEVKEDASSTPPPPVNLPFKATYSSDYSIGDPKYLETVMNFYKELQAGNTEGAKGLMQDSLYFITFDNRMVKESRDQMVDRLTAFRKKFKQLDQEFLSYVCLHSNDRNEDWVSLWIIERGEYQNGKKDSTQYQENWRFKDGKVIGVNNYARY